MSAAPPHALEEGYAALRRGAWDDARAAFEAALASDETPAAYEGLGIAARYSLDRDRAIAAHEHGYRLARERGDDDAAAALAVQLSYDAYAFTGVAEAQGWIERAAQLVEGRPPTSASAFIPFVQGYLALLTQHDPDAALERSARAAVIAREVGSVDVEMLSRAVEGLSLVSIGQVADGMRVLDAAAAAAVGGEMHDADSIETVCCFLIDACKRVRDLERAREWCIRVRGIADRFGDRQMFAVCRTHYADVLVSLGDWQAAETELAAAVDELGRLRPGRDVDAFVRLAELRRRQGRRAEAIALLAQSGSHRLGAIVEGLIALDEGDAASAVAAAQRFLRRVGARDRFERVAGLDLLVRASIATGETDAARAACTELVEISHAAPNASLRATGFVAEARLGLAEGEHGVALALLEDAVDLFTAAGARFEAAVALELQGDVHEAAGQPQRAADARRSAEAAFIELGASRPRRTRLHPLSRREEEVLKLLAQGLSNDDIATRLVLSVRTVERHVANTYAKIGASGRTARATATAWAHTHGVA